jgi:hypothetical protein
MVINSKLLTGSISLVAILDASYLIFSFNYEKNRA